MLESKKSQQLQSLFIEAIVMQKDKLDKEVKSSHFASTFDRFTLIVAMWIILGFVFAMAKHPTTYVFYLYNVI